MADHIRLGSQPGLIRLSGSETAHRTSHNSRAPASDEVGRNSDSDDEYGSLGVDEGESQIIERLLQGVASGPDPVGREDVPSGPEAEPDRQDSFRVTDIEDYEPPRGIYLPKVRGLEQTRFIQNQEPGATQLEILRDFETESGKHNCTRV